MLGLLLMIVLYYSTNSVCGVEWLQYGEYAYHIHYDSVLNQDTAKAGCAAVEGSLVVVKTTELHRFLINNIASLTAEPYSFYIGLEKIGAEFVWSDGSSVSTGLTQWFTNEPNQNPGSGPEDCVIMGWVFEPPTDKFQHYRWYDVRCSYALRYICQKYVGTLPETTVSLTTPPTLLEKLSTTVSAQEETEHVTTLMMIKTNGVLTTTSEHVEATTEITETETEIHTDKSAQATTKATHGKTTTDPLPEKLEATVVTTLTTFAPTDLVTMAAGHMKTTDEITETKTQNVNTDPYTDKMTTTENATENVGTKIVQISTSDALVLQNKLEQNLTPTVDRATTFTTPEIAQTSVAMSTSFNDTTEVKTGWISTSDELKTTSALIHTTLTGVSKSATPIGTNRTDAIRTTLTPTTDNDGKVWVKSHSSVSDQQRTVLVALIATCSVLVFVSLACYAYFKMKPIRRRRFYNLLGGHLKADHLKPLQTNNGNERKNMENPIYNIDMTEIQFAHPATLIESDQIDDDQIPNHAQTSTAV